MGESRSLGEGCEALKAYANSRGSLFFLPAYQDEELSVFSPAPCLHASCLVPHHDGHGFTL